MSRPGPRRAVQIWVLALVLGALSVGCGRSASAIEVTFYEDPHFPERHQVVFDECVYRVDADGDLHIVGRTSGAADQHSEVLHVHVFWQPKPGVTFANKTTTTATIRYARSDSQRTAVYTGTGFVYPKKGRGGRLTADIETGQVHLAARAGNPGKLSGSARLSGTLHARWDPHTTTDLMRALELHVAGELER